MEADRDAVKREWTEFVRLILNETGWTQTEIGKQCGCSNRSNVSRWLSEHPTIGTVPGEAAQERLIIIARYRGLID